MANQFFTTCPVCKRKRGWKCVTRFVLLVFKNFRMVIGLFPQLIKTLNAGNQSNTSFSVVKSRSKFQVINNNIFEHCLHYDKELAYKFWRNNCENHEALVSDNLPVINKAISFLVVIYLTPDQLHLLHDLLCSVHNQAYQNWSIIIAARGFGDNDDVTDYLNKSNLFDDKQEVLIFDEIDKADIYNQVIEQSNADYFCCLGVADRLATTALYFAALEINNHPEIKILYTDHDNIDLEGNRSNPQFKTDWNPDLFLSFNYIGTFTLFNRLEVLKNGGFKPGFHEFSQYEQILRLSEQLTDNQIFHIPLVLHHRNKNYDKPIDKKKLALKHRAIENHFTRINVKVVTQAYENNEYSRIMYELPDVLPEVSIIIPTKDNMVYLKTCVESIIEKTTYKNYEIIIVDNGSSDKQLIDYLKQLENRNNTKTRVLRYNHQFNFSAINNYAVRHSKSRILCFLNDDTEVISNEWLSEMVSQVLRPDVGMVGAKLHFRNGTIQHAGVIPGLGGIAGHTLSQVEPTAMEFFEKLQLVQNYSSVTAACMVMKRKVFEELGGFDEENFKVAYNDIDLCLKAREKNYRVVWTPFARLYHHEMISRGNDRLKKNMKRYLAESKSFAKKWEKYIGNDPYYNPNLTIQLTDCRVITTSRYNIKTQGHSSD